MRYNITMPKSDEEIRKSINNYDELLPESERNPNVKEDVELLIERAAQLLSAKPGKPRRPGGYTGKQTHPRKTEDTSD